MARKAKRAKNEVGPSTSASKQSTDDVEMDVEVDVEKEQALKALDLIGAELEKCKSKRQSQLAQNIRKILEQMREKTQRKIPVEIPFIPLSPAEKALQNAVIVRQMLSHLDSSSVLSSRQVCKIWRDEATLELLSPRHENVFKIHFEWCKGTEQYRHRNLKSLENFHATCGLVSGASANARKFLCSQTKITFKGGDLQSALECFFKDFGIYVRFLSLKPDPSNNNNNSRARQFRSTFRAILLQLTPNLQSLTLKSSWTYGRNILDKCPVHPTRDSKQDVGLQKLKVFKLTENSVEINDNAEGLPQMFIQLDQYFRRLRELAVGGAFIPDVSFNDTARKIMELSPNLQLILDPHLLHTSHILAAKKFHLVKSLDLNFPPESSNFIVKFSAANPKLTTLNFNNKNRIIPDAADVTALNSILQSSQSTLEDFHGVQDLKNITGIQLPIFPLIKKLCLAQSFNYSLNGRILPPTFEFSHIFPNVSSLQFEYLHDRSDNPFNFSGNSSSSLQHLQFGVKRKFNPLWMSKISSLYPNLNSLHVKISNKYSLFPLVCKSIWICLHQLKVLHLTLDFDFDSDSDSEFNHHDNENDIQKEEKQDENAEMDSIFTGLSRNFCEKLKEGNSELNRVDVSLDKLREFPSILDMTKLTELKISCGKIHPKKLWSHVTENHAFEKLKQRQNTKISITRKIQ